jgi:hypothetical protein
MYMAKNRPSSHLLLKRDGKGKAKKGARGKEHSGQVISLS